MQSRIKALTLREILAATLVVLMALALIAPLTAQEGDAALDELTEAETAIVVGPISFSENGDIVVVSIDEVTGEVTSYIIAPAGAFTPSSVAEGDMVIIMGRLLPDGATVQTITFEFFVEEEPEVTPEATAEATEAPEVTPEATAEVTPEATQEATPEVTAEPEVTPEATPEFETCGNTNHPVAARLSEEFGISQEEIVAMHCDGNGYGNIARALLMAREAGEAATAWDFLERHQNGEGWGHILRESGMHPSEFAPGRIGKDQSDDDEEVTDDEAATTIQSSSQGNGNGNGNGNNGNGGGNGNNGNGGGNGNGQGNGDGNGNNGNGGGNGGGRGND